MATPRELSGISVSLLRSVIFSRAPKSYILPHVARVRHYAQLIIFDALAIIFMIAAILTGWLPGPGGIPLFIIGLSLLAINHEWAERYIRLLQKYANMIGDIIFIHRLRVMYDLLSPTLVIWGIYFVLDVNFSLSRTIGIFMIFLGIVIFFCNRNRWKRLKKSIKLKQ